MLSNKFLFYWDKYERSLYWLARMGQIIREMNGISTNLSKDEEIELSKDQLERVIGTFIHDGIDDGGQFSMGRFLVSKYGIVPQEVYPESFHSNHSSNMNRLINTLVRTAYLKMKTNYNDIDNIVDQTLKEIQILLNRMLGKPPSGSFEWVRKQDQDCNEKIDDSKTKSVSKFLEKSSVITLTYSSPIEFENQMIRPYFNITKMVSIIHDPRHPFPQQNTVSYLGYINHHISHLNLDLNVMKGLTQKMIQNKKAVWIAADVDRNFFSEADFADENRTNDLKRQLFNVDNIDCKIQRLESGESIANHAMCIVGYHQHKNGKIDRWKIENSWGSEESKMNGYLVCTDDWFDHNIFETIVDIDILKKYVSLKDLKYYVYLPWDPMGAVAKY